MTLIEILVGMTIFAIGLLSLSRVMFGVMHANLRSKHTVIATNLAHQRMEHVLGAMRYDSITQAQYPDEAYGQVDNGNAEYAKYSRTVTIADSLNAVGTSVMKEITVRVEWREAGDTRNIELRSSISRFKDISL
jgi:type II secretory pathway pseudopilin PulG